MAVAKGQRAFAATELQQPESFQIVLQDQLTLTTSERRKETVHCDGLAVLENDDKVISGPDHVLDVGAGHAQLDDGSLFQLEL